MLDQATMKLYSKVVQTAEVSQVAVHTTYSAARQQLAEFWRRVEEDREAVIISRRGHEDVALIAAEELTSLRETAHLLRSPANARRLLRALDRALADGGTRLSLNELKRGLGLGGDIE